jgi:hypothetical protein
LQRHAGIVPAEPARAEGLRCALRPYRVDDGEEKGCEDDDGEQHPAIVEDQDPDGRGHRHERRDPRIPPAGAHQPVVGAGIGFQGGDHGVILSLLTHGHRQSWLSSDALQCVFAVEEEDGYRKGVDLVDASQIYSALPLVLVEDVDAALGAVRMANDLVLEQVDLDALSTAQNAKAFWIDLHGHHRSKASAD